MPAQRAINRSDHAERSHVPPQLLPLLEISGNLWSSWDAPAAALFERIDPALWHGGCTHNPVLFLRRVSATRLARLAEDKAFVRDIRETARRLRSYLGNRQTWYERCCGRKARGVIAYFSMEFGLHESLPIFAGGLGVLAGDHFKSASDLGVPLVGVGIFWRQGYNRQLIAPDGRQHDGVCKLNAADLPLVPVVDRAGRRLRVRIPIDSEVIVAQAWRLDVGRVPIFLLDTNLPANPRRHRVLTDRLYSGDYDTRIRQEIVLGIGGWRLLRALTACGKRGLAPSRARLALSQRACREVPVPLCHELQGTPVAACHLNEGHAAFCALERVAELIRDRRLDFADACRHVAATTVFTTHTPIPDGNETFAPKLVEAYLSRYCRLLGIGFAELLALGRVDPTDANEPFGMTPLALRLAERRNGVSELHGAVSRRMWRGMWPGRPAERVPIGAITNGIHLRTWMHPKMAELLDGFLPRDWEERQDDPVVWKAARRIPDDELWGLHQEFKRELFEFIGRRLAQQAKRYPPRLRRRLPLGEALDPSVLTIGFARRSTRYKRSTLFFTDLRRAERVINHPTRPVQIIFAGKAHPSDEGGKALVAQIVRHARSPRFRGRVVFLEDYDMDVARHLVAGVDVWLNNPRRPQEASGTSGMKPALHGGLNLSILDGWWPEACREGVNGWAIGDGRDHDGGAAYERWCEIPISHQEAASDKRDARLLYERLERDVVPLYYARSRGGLPTRWLHCMKAALAGIPAAFSSHRMVKEYVTRYYLPAMKAGVP